MKKQFLMLLLLCLVCLIVASCSKNETPQNDTPESISSNNSTDNIDTEIQDSVDESVVVDVDLTTLSSTMVYAEVYNIMTNPEDYLGKTIKISGPYSASYYEETDQYYHFVIIEDAAACCAQGIEFLWNGEHTYPDDYPDEQTKIEVVGIFGSYEELGQTYYYLAVDDIVNCS